MFSARGLNVTEATAEEHDRAMAVVQVLTHFQTQVLGLALARLSKPGAGALGSDKGFPLEESLKFTSPAYLMDLYVVGRHFAQSPSLYGPIEMLNPQKDKVMGVARDTAKQLSEVISTGDQERFAAMFEEVRAFFGPFSEEALEQSSYVIDRLVERS
ncbi:MAG: prephenate dehydrogenase dimerization domain-containing protein, partial [Phycisphaerae bacterium]